MRDLEVWRYVVKGVVVGMARGFGKFKNSNVNIFTATAISSTCVDMWERKQVGGNWSFYPTMLRALMDSFLQTMAITLQKVPAKDSPEKHTTALCHEQDTGRDVPQPVLQFDETRHTTMEAFWHPTTL